MVEGDVQDLCGDKRQSASAKHTPGQTKSLVEIKTKTETNGDHQEAVDGREDGIWLSDPKCDQQPCTDDEKACDDELFGFHTSTMLLALLTPRWRVSVLWLRFHVKHSAKNIAQTRSNIRCVSRETLCCVLLESPLDFRSKLSVPGREVR